MGTRMSLETRRELLEQTAGGVPTVTEQNRTLRAALGTA